MPLSGEFSTILRSFQQFIVENSVENLAYPLSFTQINVNTLSPAHCLCCFLLPLPRFFLSALFLEYLRLRFAIFFFSRDLHCCSASLFLPYGVIFTFFLSAPRYFSACCLKCLIKQRSLVQSIPTHHVPKAVYLLSVNPKSLYSAICVEKLYFSTKKKRADACAKRHTVRLSYNPRSSSSARIASRFSLGMDAASFSSRIAFLPLPRRNVRNQRRTWHTGRRTGCLFKMG